MTLSKSWAFTLILYSFSMFVIMLEVFTGIVITDSQVTMILGMIGLSTSAGTANAVLSNREQLKKFLNDLQNPIKKTT